MILLVSSMALMELAIKGAAVLLAAGVTTGMAEESIEPDFLGNVRQVTSGFVKAGEGYFSPDMKTVIYQAVQNLDESTDIVQMEAGGWLVEDVESALPFAACAGELPRDL